MSDDKSEDRSLILLSGMWLNESQSGVVYMSGGMGIGGKLLMFKNKNKAKDSDADYYLYIAPKQAQNSGVSDADEIPF